MNFEAFDMALDDLPRYMAVTQPAKGWLPGEGDSPMMIACVSVDDAREMLRRHCALIFTAGGRTSTEPGGSSSSNVGEDASTGGAPAPTGVSDPALPANPSGEKDA